VRAAGLKIAILVETRTPGHAPRALPLSPRGSPGSSMRHRCRWKSCWRVQRPPRLYFSSRSIGSVFLRLPSPLCRRTGGTPIGLGVRHAVWSWCNRSAQRREQAAGRAGFRDHHSRGIAGAGRGVERGRQERLSAGQARLSAAEHKRCLRLDHADEDHPLRHQFHN
jgi:hypothetical protein